MCMNRRPLKEPPAKRIPRKPNRLDHLQVEEDVYLVGPHYLPSPASPYPVAGRVHYFPLRAGVSPIDFRGDTKIQGEPHPGPGRSGHHPEISTAGGTYLPWLPDVRWTVVPGTALFSLVTHHAS